MTDPNVYDSTRVTSRCEITTPRKPPSLLLRIEVA